MRASRRARPVLAGVKVWDASWVGVGPLTAKYLADYGALVVHTETASRPDVLRNGPPFRDGIPGINRSQFFADFNASKYGMGLDLKHPRGKAVALALAAVGRCRPGVVQPRRHGPVRARLRGPV